MKNNYISIKDQLPENGKNVMLSFKWKHNNARGYCIGYYTESFKIPNDSGIDDFDDYCEETDVTYLPKGFYENQNFGDYHEFGSILISEFEAEVDFWCEIPRLER